MDPATIAAGVVALLAPYLKKAGEEFAGEAGKIVLEKAGGLWQRLRAAFDGDAPATAVLDEFEREPSANSDQLRTTLEAKMGADRPLADDVAAAIAEIKRAAPYVRVVQRMTEAETLVGIKAKRLKAGTIDVTQDVGTATNVTGVELDEIG